MVIAQCLHDWYHAGGHPETAFYESQTPPRRYQIADLGTDYDSTLISRFFELLYTPNRSVVAENES